MLACIFFVTNMIDPLIQREIVDEKIDWDSGLSIDATQDDFDPETLIDIHTVWWTT
jgi:hypothetical protein